MSTKKRIADLTAELNHAKELDVVTMSSTFCSKSCKIAELLFAQGAGCIKTARVDLMLRMSIILRS